MTVASFMTAWAQCYEAFQITVFIGANTGAYLLQDLLAFDWLAQIFHAFVPGRLQGRDLIL
jgi:hypothetical protein